MSGCRVTAVAAAAEPSSIDEVRVREFEPTAEVAPRPNERARLRPVRAAETYAELGFAGVTGIACDGVDLVAPLRRHRPSGRELEILAALWEHEHLLVSQVHRRWWWDSSLRACQQGLSRMARAGWVRRLRFTAPGACQRIYCLTEGGFALARRHGTLRGPYVDWVEPRSGDPRAVLRNLHANAWAFALQALAPGVVGNLRGARTSRIGPPPTRGEDAEAIPLGGGRVLRDASLDAPEPVHPAASLEVRAGPPGAVVAFDLLVELVRGKRAVHDESRARRYDLLVAGWFRMVERYERLGLPPVVVFVCEDERQALASLRAADRVATTRVAEAGVPEAEWACPARRQLLWVAERDVHDGRLDAWALPLHPPAVRKRMEGPDGARCRPRRVRIVDPRLLELTAATHPDPVGAG